MKFQRGREVVTPATFLAFLSSSGRTVKGYGAEAITPKMSFRHFIWRLLVLVLATMRNTVDSVAMTRHFFLILLEFETSKVKVLANSVPVLQMAAFLLCDHVTKR